MSTAERELTTVAQRFRKTGQLAAARVTDRFRVSSVEDSGLVSVVSFDPNDQEPRQIGRLRDAVLDLDDDVVILRLGGQDVVIGALQKPGDVSPVETAIQTADMLADRRYDIQRFGAKRGRGMSAAERTANALAINAAATESLGGRWPTHDSSVGTVVMKGEYEVDPGIELACNVDASNAVLFVYGADGTTPPAMFIGTKKNVNMWGMKLDLPKLRNFPSSRWYDPQQATGAIGLEIANAVDCDIQITEVAYFERNVRFTAYGTKGNVSNRVSIGSILDGRRGIELRPMDTSAWVNENKFFGGHFGINAGTYGVDKAEAAHIEMYTSSGGNTINNNIFYAPNLEGSTPYYVVQINRGTWNTIHDARWERPSGNPARVYCGGDATCRLNTVMMGYGTWDVEITNAGGASSNYVLNQWSLMHAGRSQMGSFTAPGTMVGRQPVYDNKGTLLGYVPIYDAIT